jgi:hypothetical protein
MSGILQLINTFPSGGFAVKNSLRFRSNASAYLSRTPSVTGNRQTWTWADWVKRGSLGANRALFSTSYTSLAETYVRFNSSDQLEFTTYTNGGTNYYSLVSNQVFRDPSAWYFIQVVFDTTNATSSNRMRLYVNGIQITSFASSAYPPQNYNGQWNDSAYTHYIGAYEGTGAFFDGYMAEINFIDGQALTPSSFGAFDATSGVWQPVKYSGTYGTNGFYLKFSDTTSTTTLCYDYSGNGNNWTPNNISLTSGSTYDSMLDSPTNYDNGGNGVGNYAVLNPLQIGSGTLSDGNITFSSLGNTVKATIGISTGKWYWEINNPGATTLIGISSISDPISNYLGAGSGGYSYGASNGNKNNNGSSVAYGATFGNTDTIGIAFDADIGTLTFYKNNTSQGTAFTGLSSGPYFPAISYNTGSTTSGYANFGQRPFAYTPPTGYKALNTQNLPAASIVNGASFMAATLYTGNGSTQSIVNAVNGVSFQPDFVWVKDRTSARNHKLTDSVRGATLALKSNLTDAESTDSTGLTTFNSNGFTLGSDVTYNTSGENYIAWNWKANGTAVTNTAGSITSQVSANTTAGFSVVTFTAQNSGTATIGHGLGIAPSMFITKQRAQTGSWGTYHVSLGNTQRILLDTTAAAVTTSSYWNNTSPTSSVFTLGTGFATAGDMVAYCFAAIPGYSAFGSYTGNGSTDGPFVYCGFRPRFVLVKEITSGGTNWLLKDTSRDPYNISSHTLFPNTSGAEDTADSWLDINANGFKIRYGSVLAYNQNGNNYIYAAFAENPLKYSLAR